MFKQCCVNCSDRESVCGHRSVFELQSMIPDHDSESAMPAVVACPKCKTKYKLPDNILGKPIKCKSCGTAFQTKAPDAAKSASTTATKSKPAGTKASAAELAKFGLDGPLRRQPDVFEGATPISAKAPDTLGNLAADPGFVEQPLVKQSDEGNDDGQDPMADIFANPALEAARAKRENSQKVDPNKKEVSDKEKMVARIVGAVFFVACMLIVLAVKTDIMWSIIWGALGGGIGGICFQIVAGNPKLNWIIRIAISVAITALFWTLMIVFVVNGSEEKSDKPKGGPIRRPTSSLDDGARLAAGAPLSSSQT